MIEDGCQERSGDLCGAPLVFGTDARRQIARLTAEPLMLPFNLIQALSIPRPDLPEGREKNLFLVSEVIRELSDEADGLPLDRGRTRFPGTGVTVGAPPLPIHPASFGPRPVDTSE